jgi:CRP-like cAMP-binding protein
MDVLLSALRGHGLDVADAAALLEAAGPPRTRPAGERLIFENESPSGLLIIASGVAKSHRNLRKGVAQTLALFTPGDIVGAAGLALRRETTTVTALTTCQTATVPATQLRRLVKTHPAISEALWRATAREAAMLQEWLVGVGRRTAMSRIAHLMCELVVRTRPSLRTVGEAYIFPLTQVELADAVGLSVVHVNRVMQTLRAEGLVHLARGRLQIGDWARLVEVAEFDPAYLRFPTPSSGDPHAAFLFPPGDPVGMAEGRVRK